MNIAVASSSIYGMAALEALRELDVRVCRIYAFEPRKAERRADDLSADGAWNEKMNERSPEHLEPDSPPVRPYAAVVSEPRSAYRTKAGGNSELFETSPGYRVPASDGGGPSGTALTVREPDKARGQASMSAADRDSKGEAARSEEAALPPDSGALEEEGPDEAMLRNERHQADSGAGAAGFYSSSRGIRRMRSWATADFARFSAQSGIPLQLTEGMNRPDVYRQLALDETDLLLVVGWPELLGRELLELPPLGVVGLHATLLPEGRGFASIRRPILEGLAFTGVSMHYLNETVSGGDLLGQTLIPIHHRETSTTLLDKVMRTHKALVKLYVPLLLGGMPPKRVRQDDGAAVRWKREDIGTLRLDWTLAADRLDRQIRAGSDPYPYSFTCLEEYKIYILEAYPLGQSIFPPLEPGTVAEADIRTGQFLVQTGQGMLRIDIWRQESPRPAIHIREGCRFC